MPSSPQTLALVQVFDYSYGPDGKALQGKRVKVTLGYDQAITVATEPVVNLEQQEVYSAVTDANGYWTLSLVPNNRITPANTYYTVNVEGYRSYQITVSDQSVPVGGWQTSAILLSAASVLSPVSQTVGNLTVTGTLTVSGTLSIAGSFTVSGNLAVTGTLTVSGLSIEQGGLTVTGGITMADAGVSRIIPSAAGFSIRNNANTADNLAMTDPGVATIRGGLTVTAGGLTVSAGGASITGLLTAASGVSVTTGGLTVVAGGAIITGSPDLTLGSAASRIVPGATSLSLRNNANTADNLLMTDAGLGTLRNALGIPPSAGGTVAPSSYGSVAVKYDEQTPSSAASVLIPASGSIPGTFRLIRIRYRLRTTSGNATDFLNLRLGTGGGAVDTGTNYDQQNLVGSGASASAGSNTAQTSIRVGIIVGGTGTATKIAEGEIVITDYANASFHKTVRGFSFAYSGSGSPSEEMDGGDWANTGAVTSVALLPSAGNLTGVVFTYLEP